MNTNQLVHALNEDFFTIGVKYGQNTDRHDRPKGLLIEDCLVQQLSPKEYTYKVHKGTDLDIGDMVNVLTYGKFLTVGLVTRVDKDEAIDYDSMIDYHFIVGKVDFNQYNELRLRDVKIMEAVRAATKRAARRQSLIALREELGEEEYNSLIGEVHETPAITKE